MVVIHEKLPSEQHFLRDLVWSCIAGKSLDFLIRETGDAPPAHIYIVIYIVKISEWNVAVVQPICWSRLTSTFLPQGMCRCFDSARKKEPASSLRDDPPML